MSLDEFRLAVIGDEPAGLWLLKKYDGAMAEQEIRARMAWVSLQRQVPSVCLPAGPAAHFGITHGQTWHAEVLSPERSLLWAAPNLAEAFPSLRHKAAKTSESGAIGAQAYFGHTAAVTSAIRHALQAHPELLSFASGVWKFIGRTHQIHAESVVHGALMGTELAMWQPDEELPHLQRIAIAPQLNPIEKVECLSNGSISLKFHAQPPIVSHHWILNLSVHQLALLSRQSPEFKKLVSIASGMRARHALYCLRLRVEAAGIPCPVRPLSIFFDTEAIPDLETETWPIQLFHHGKEKELVLWASAPQQASLEAILERFRQGMTRLHHLFPFLDATLMELSTPLDMESCASPAARAAALEDLEESRIEVYDMTAFHTATRHRALSALMPFVNCHLPYPLGPLQAAEALLPGLVPKKKKNRTSQKAGDANAKSSESTRAD